MSEFNNDVIDIQQFDELKDLLEEDFIDLVKTYMKDSLMRLQELQEAYETDDNAKGFDAAHTLKGASANLGARYLTELCYQMQEACRNQKITLKKDLLDAIERELTLVHQEVNLRIAQL